MKEANIGDDSRRGQASVSRDTAVHAIKEAKAALEAPIDAKLQEISSSRLRVTNQIKDLKTSISAARKHGKCLEEVFASFDRHQDFMMQHEIEQLDRDVRIIEHVQKLSQGQNW